MSETTNDTTRLESLEQLIPTLFLAAGIMWLVSAAINSLIHFTGVLSMEVLSQVFISSAMMLAMTGLVGFYPKLADWRSNVAKVCLGIAVLAAIGAFAIVIWSLLSVVLPDVNVLESESPAIAILVVTGLLLLLNPLLYGSIVLRSGAFPRIVGGLLLAEAAIMTFVVFGPTDALPRGIYLVGVEIIHSSIFLSIGFTLRTSLTSTTRTEPTPA